MSKIILHEHVINSHNITYFLSVRGYEGIEKISKEAFDLIKIAFNMQPDDQGGHNDGGGTTYVYEQGEGPVKGFTGGTREVGFASADRALSTGELNHTKREVLKKWCADKLVANRDYDIEKYITYHNNHVARNIDPDKIIEEFRLFVGL